MISVDVSMRQCVCGKKGWSGNFFPNWDSSAEHVGENFKLWDPVPNFGTTHSPAFPRIPRNSPAYSPGEFGISLTILPAQTSRERFARTDLPSLAATSASALRAVELAPALRVDHAIRCSQRFLQRAPCSRCSLQRSLQLARIAMQPASQRAMESAKAFAAVTVAGMTNGFTVHSSPATR